MFILRSSANKRKQEIYEQLQIQKFNCVAQVLNMNLSLLAHYTIYWLVAF